MSKKKNATEKKPIYKRKWFIAVIVIIVLAVIGNVIGGGDHEKGKTEDTNGKKVEVKKEESKKNIEQIIQDNFSDSKATIEYNKDNNNLYLSVEAPDYATASAAYNTQGGNLARCIKEVQKEYPETNWDSVTISSKSFPSIILCEFNADKVKNYKDWDNFSQKDLEKLCNAYYDCRK